MAICYLLNTFNLTTDLSKYLDISPSRLEKIKKYQKEQRLKESLGAMYLLDMILENNYFLNPREITYIYNESGKPFIKDKNIFFSISHSNGIAGVIVSHSEIGFDIEEIKEVNKKVVNKVLNSYELDIYNKLPEKDKLIYFYEVWCSKEAYVKKLGTSITINPSNIMLEEDVVTKVYSVNKKLYMTAVCGASAYSIIERNIPKELLKEKK